MCLLIVLHRAHPDAPLIVAANRDEMLERPALPTAVLREASPRTLGGRDLVGGGTWMAINEHGVFAGLTNRPTLTRDVTKRSRGELPLALTALPTARAAVREFAERVRPVEYGPAWLLVGDRASLAFVDMTEGETPRTRGLDPGLHVLENRAFDVPSPKVEHVREALRDIASVRGDALIDKLFEVLRDHTVPHGTNGDSGVEGFLRPAATEANCVHAGSYGTRSASILVVGDGVPRVWSTAGPPCTSPLIEQTRLWNPA